MLEAVFSLNNLKIRTLKTPSIEHVFKRYRTIIFGMTYFSVKSKIPLFWWRWKRSHLTQERIKITLLPWRHMTTTLFVRYIFSVKCNFVFFTAEKLCKNIISNKANQLGKQCSNKRYSIAGLSWGFRHYLHLSSCF